MVTPSTLMHRVRRRRRSVLAPRPCSRRYLAFRARGRRLTRRPLLVRSTSSTPPCSDLIHLLFPLPTLSSLFRNTPRASAPCHEWDTSRGNTASMHRCRHAKTGNIGSGLQHSFRDPCVPPVIKIGAGLARCRAECAFLPVVPGSSSLAASRLTHPKH